VGSGIHLGDMTFHEIMKKAKNPLIKRLQLGKKYFRNGQKSAKVNFETKCSRYQRTSEQTPS
jgi:hypothetical protein